MLKRALVAVAHGSADPRAAAAIGELMPLVARRAADRGLSVPDLRVAYLGHAAPSVPQVMRRFGPDTQVTVLPLLLTAAYHSKTDIPRVLARAGTARLNVTYGAPLGPHPLLLRALERRLPKTAFENSSALFQLPTVRLIIVCFREDGDNLALHLRNNRRRIVATQL